MTQKFVYDSSNIDEVYSISRALPSQTIELWLDTTYQNVSGQINGILDIGCGDGRFSVPLSLKFNTMVYGVDPSKKMLAVAKKREEVEHQVEYLQGTAENIPLTNGAVSMVFMSMVYHHLDDIVRATYEINRVLTPQGYLVVRNATKEDILQNELFNFFPTAKEIELQRLPSEKEVVLNFQTQGFSLVDNRVLNQIFALNPQEFYDKVSQRGLSAFRLISDSDFEEGLKQFKEYCERKPTDDRIYEGFHLFIFQKKQRQ